MYQKGLVSVIIPTYRRTATLARAIKSVVHQTYNNIEVLVVDDNEPGDEYSKEVKNLIANLNYPQVHLVTQQKHKNGAAARNAGIRVAKGQYISFLDDDDLWYPNKLERQVEVLSQKDKTVGGVSSIKIFFKRDTLTHISEKWETKPTQSFDILSKRLNIQTCTVLLRRECLDDTGYFNENLNRHQEVQLMAFFTDKYKIDLINEILTIIDSSDVINRPTYNKLKTYKENYFKAVEPLLQKLSSHDKRFVLKNHMTELAWVMYRDQSKLKGILLLIKCFTNIRVIKAFFSRVIEKRQNYKRIESFSDKDYVLSMINS